MTNSVRREREYTISCGQAYKTQTQEKIDIDSANTADREKLSFDLSNDVSTRIDKYGLAALSDCELLDMFYCEGREGDGAQILKQFGSLKELIEAASFGYPQISMSDQTSKKNEGVLSRHSLFKLKVAEEINARVLLETLRERPLLSSKTMLYEYLRATMASKGCEQFRVLFLDSQLRLIQSEVINDGTVSECAVYPREVVRRALEVCAHAMILVHNHPAHTTTASERDCSLTRTVVAAAAALGIVVPDHLIVAGDEIVSIHEQYPSCFNSPWSKADFGSRFAPA